MFFGFAILSYFFPLPKNLEADGIWLVAIFRQVLFAAFVYVQMCLLFQIKKRNSLFMLSAGLSLMQINHAIVALMGMTELLGNIRFGILTKGQSVELILMPLLIFVAFVTLARTVNRRKLYNKGNTLFNIIGLVIMTLNNVFSRFPYMFGEANHYSLFFYQLFTAALSLTVQFAFYHIVSLESEKLIVEHIVEEGRRQDEMTKDAIDAINVKCHDLKHKLYAQSVGIGEEGQEIKNIVEIYDSSIHTGNGALDILLMDYRLRYKEEDIDISFLGNGKSLSFMRQSDLYSLFSNAISNAVEAVELLEDKKKKQISINLEDKGEIVYIVVRNYFKGEQVRQGHLPKTSKKKNVSEHGFGLRSMKMVAQKYGGDLTAWSEGDIFTLSVYLTKK